MEKSKHSVDFPQYRRYPHNKTYFKIDSKTHFKEVQLLNGELVYYNFEAKILPDRNYINDLLYNYEPYWEKCTEKDYINFLNLYS